VAKDATLSGAALALGGQSGDSMRFETLTFQSVGAVSIAEDDQMLIAGQNAAGSLVLRSTATLGNLASPS